MSWLYNTQRYTITRVSWTTDLRDISWLDNKHRYTITRVSWITDKSNNDARYKLVG